MIFEGLVQVLLKLILVLCTDFSLPVWGRGYSGETVEEIVSQPVSFECLKHHKQ